MKNTVLKSVLALVMAFMALPMMGQDFLNIYFKDGTQRKFYLRGVTEFSTSQFDASGVKHNDFDFQHVKTPDFNYVYDLAKIDSITFSKFDEDKTRRDFSAAMTTVLTVTSDCESIDDAEKKLPQIKASEGVEDAWSDGHELFVKINKWETISFHFNHDADDAAYENESSSLENMRKMIPQLRKVIKDGHQPKVVVANQQHFDDNRAYYIRDHYKPLLDEFAKCGFDTCYLQRPTLEFFARDIYQYDVVFLITHGNIYTGGHSFVTGENLGEILKNGDPSQEVLREWNNVLNSLDFFKQYENRGSVYRSYNEEYRGKKIYWVGHPGVLESFFGTTQEGGVSEGFFPEGAIFFNTACRSMMNDEDKHVIWHSLADKFIDNHGLTLYLGYSESDSVGKKAGPEFFKSMLQGKSVGKAYQDLPPNYKKEGLDEGAELKMWPEDSEGIFLVPTYTNEISSEKAQTNFNYNQTVEVEGFTTFNFSETTDSEGVIAYTNPANISMGFEYSTNEELLGPGRFTDKVEVTYLTKSIDKGNVKFRASLLDLEPNNTYYYRAFTSDGSFINYGKPESFSIYDKLILSTNSITIPDLTSSGGVSITSGSGSYSIEKIEPTGVVTASINENHISIEALTAGSAIITVKDDKSGETATIEVKVEWEHLSFSISGNIDLKVGESTTVDITSGSRSYSIEKIEPTGVVTASVSEDHISIEALTGGSATITVKDDKSGETAPIEVKVEWDHLSFAITGNVDLKVGESTTIDITSGSGSYSIEKIEPTGVVNASISENSVIIEALTAGTATITVKDDKSGEKAPIEVKVQVKDIPAEAIDLGLPSGILWASYNVGATKPEEYGGYFAWGEIEEKDVYYWTTYSHCDGVSNSCHDIGADISGTKFDVAYMRWGDEWRMPTAEEFKELVYKCDHQVTTQNGVYGFKFTGPNGNSIFFPAAGYHFNTGINKAGSSGEYWSSTVRENNNYAYDTSMSVDYVYWDCYINRFAGLPVRPVKQAAPALEDLVLSTTSPISLKAGETYAVQIISGNGVYSFDNTNPKVATYEIEGNTITISAVSAGTTTITVKDDKSEKAAYLEVNVTGSVVDIPADVIDLGLKSGKKWASYNVGALSPEDYGGYFAWGETETKVSYTVDNYIANVDLTKEYITVISGTEHDAARVHWGENWRMPTILEIRELLRECTSKWDTVNGVKGRRFIGPNGNSIFLPAAGAYYDDSNYYEGSSGRYWSAEQVWDGTKAAFYLSFSSSGTSGDNRSAFYVGMPIRPVYCGSTDHMVDLKLSSIGPVCLPIGEYRTIEIISGNNSYNILNSDESVATVSQGGWASIEQGTSGKSVVISAVATGITIVTIFDNMSGQKITIAVKVIDPNSTIDIIGHEAVDLGLPSGTLWASNNIGAEKEEDYGDYYAWGETEQKDKYSSYTYAFNADKNDEESCVYLGDIAGTEFDVAHVKWGGLWQMPTQEQFKELIEHCESWYTKHNGVPGMLFTGPNGKKIFLPAAGLRTNSIFYSQGDGVLYWSSTPSSTNSYTSYYFYVMNITDPSQARYIGLSVRPVANSNTQLSNLTLSDDYIRLNVGESGSIEITSGNGSYTVASSDASVATAKLQSGTTGTSIVVDALSIGEVTIFVTDNNCGQIRRIELRIVNVELNGHEAVDLGLTSGNLWASCNVGATSPEEFGGFYAWGETDEKESYSWGTYTHCDGSYSTCHDIGEDISGTEYDVAHVKWGGSWKMPNKTQLKELLDECSSEWTKVNDVNGYRFTGPNGNSIFIPAAGYYGNARHYGSGKVGEYWSSSQDSPTYFSNSMGFEKGYIERTAIERYYGFTIRPIVE